MDLRVPDHCHPLSLPHRRGRPPAPTGPAAGQVTFRTPDGRPTRAASFVGDQTLLGCLSRVLRLPGVVCELTVLPMIYPRGTRADAARQAAAIIGTVTGADQGWVRGWEAPRLLTAILSA